MSEAKRPIMADRPEPPSYELVTRCLEEHLRFVGELLDRLSRTGTRPLSAEEKAVVREIMAGAWFREVVSELRFGFFNGDPKLVESVTHTLLSTLAELD